MRILITTGSTMGLIDDVRGIGNIFKGGTGTRLAIELAELGEEITLITSNPGLLRGVEGVKVCTYVTFDDLARVMEEEIVHGGYDMVIHSAAVNDFTPTGVFVAEEGEQLRQLPADGKISSGHKELYVRLVPTYKIVDKIRGEWGFEGLLVKFKLQVGMSDHELVTVAAKSMQDSGADVIVANCKEWQSRRAIVISKGYTRPLRVQPIARNGLTKTLQRICHEHSARSNGIGCGDIASGAVGLVS